MTTEFGPRDERPSVLGKTAGLLIVGAVRIMNAVGDGVRMRYDRSTARLSITGESEYSGDEFARGQLVLSVIFCAMVLPVVALIALRIGAIGLFELFGESVAYLLFLVATAVSLFSIPGMIGLYSVADQISVVDHTTEPAPDALDDVKERYQNGDIDEEELEREAAEVWDR
ncbi:hypothetical protein DQW50_16310 [Halorubrum sp. 48-1-W]|uniref:hypothetical protein n=1 Tax=Halorubrum sp. 48-1-W TaxID=2249761 RepID=UPI000DCCF9D6|nr:hypothetical protein [Halorubrum sp. 48-1-W]RAW44085.1 hypothetical protein DQW50_16310 [Halorubrum sp. 48-1-W]